MNTVATHIARYGLYTDQIILTNPFCDLMVYDELNSPLVRPLVWRQVAVNQVLFLASIENWVKADLAAVVPPLSWTDPRLFLKELVPRSQARHAGLSRSQQDRLKQAATDELFDNIHPDDWDALAKAMNVPKEVADRGRERTRAAYLGNPQRYRWRGPTVTNEMLKFGTGHSVESAVFSADSFGAYLLFGNGAEKLDFEMAVEAGLSQRTELGELTDLSRAVGQLDLTFLNAVDLDFVLALRQDGKLASFRSFLVKLWETVSQDEKGSSRQTYQMFMDELGAQYAQYREEWKEIDRVLLRNFASAAAGAGIATLSGALGFAVAFGGAAGFGIQQILDAQTTRERHLRQPLGVFLRLDEKLAK